jgi:hypothetical protein
VSRMMQAAKVAFLPKMRRVWVPAFAGTTR